MGARVLVKIAPIAITSLMGLSELTLAEVPASSDSLVILVTEGQRANNASVVLASEPVSRLASDPAVAFSRMGGRGVDPVIRGQSQERVDVLLDGIRVEGACPNRMDPPTSRFSSALPPALEVRTSNHTLRWGPITGGQVVATTAAPNFNRAMTTGHLTIGGADNGQSRFTNGSVAVGGDSGWLRLAVARDEADDYEDGSGRDVRSAYENTEGRADVTWKSSNGFYIKGLVSRQEERDIKYAGAGMDTPEANTDMVRLELGAPVAKGSWSLLTWQADVDHLMDNFSLRQPSSMKMESLSKTRTQGIRLILDQSPDMQSDWAIGVDYETNNWNIRNFSGATLSPLDSVRRPDADRDRFGVFAERFYRVMPELQLGGGVRYDRVNMNTDDAGRAFGIGMMAMSAEDAYSTVYGTTNVEATDDNISGFINSDWRFAPGQSLEVTASHSVRSPGVNERYMVRWGMMPAMSWVGNPALEPEKHNKLEIALSGQRNGWHWHPAVWVDQVDDFVLRTRNSSQVSIQRNIDARLLGVEGELGWSNGTWSATSKLASVRGRNRDDNKPLPQIPPVQFVQTLGWQSIGHQVELAWQVARRQDRVDLASGQDVGTSSGYGVLNLSGSHPLMDYLAFSWSVENLFDNTWAAHVNRANTDPLSPEVVRVNEPGRTLSAALTVSW